jgi:probable phosphoglycerate mutase
MQLYILRHGETEFNKKGIVQGGGVDSDLNETGRKQAETFYNFYKHLEFDAVYASDLKSTHQTLEPWVQGHGYTFNIEPAIREFSWGRMEGKVPTAEDNEAFWGVKQAWTEGRLHLGVEGGDNPISFWNRLEPAIRRLQEQHKGQRVLACSHGRTLRILLSNLIGEGMHQMELFQHKNTGLNILHFLENGLVEAHKINDVQHLEILRQN